jgi:uncharacterized protein YdaU (DUF1376 family)
MNPAMDRPTGKRPAFLWYPKDAQTDGRFRVLKPHAFCLYMHLLELQWLDDGIPNDEKFLMDYAQTFFISKHMFRKIWPSVKNFFEERDGRLYNARLERERENDESFRAKRRESSKLANIARWGKQADSEFSGAEISYESSSVTDTGRTPISSLAFPPAFPPSSVTSSSDKDSRVVNPPPPPNPHGGGGGGNSLEKLSQATEPKTLTDGEYRMFVEHCQTLTDGERKGIDAPTRVLAQRLRDKFPDLPASEAVKRFVFFAGQVSPGLWDSKTREEIEAQWEKDKQEPFKKPTKTEECWSRVQERLKAHVGKS